MPTRAGPVRVPAIASNRQKTRRGTTYSLTPALAATCTWVVVMLAKVAGNGSVGSAYPDCRAARRSASGSAAPTVSMRSSKSVSRSTPTAMPTYGRTHRGERNCSSCATAHRRTS